MKKQYLVLSLFLIAVFTTVTITKVNSKLTSPPFGSSGDAFTNMTCVQGGCHAGPLHTPSAGDLSLTIGTGTPTTPLNSSFIYTPGTVYNVAFLINLFVTPNPYYGFQIVALDNSHNKAGTMVVTNAATTQINTSVATGTRQYMGHRNANSTKNWSFKWTSPAASTGPVTFCYAFNTASVSAVPPTLPEGTIYQNCITIQEGPSGIDDISNQISALNIFPNPVSSEFSISFDLKEANTVSLLLYSLDGKICKQLLNEKLSEGNFNRFFDINDIPSGIYLMKLNVGEASVTKKIIKQ